MEELEKLKLVALSVGLQFRAGITPVPGHFNAIWCVPKDTPEIDHSGLVLYNPHVNLGQQMELVRTHFLHIDQRPGLQVSVQDPKFRFIEERKDCNLGKAIVDCVVRILHAEVVDVTQ